MSEPVSERVSLADAEDALPPEMNVIPEVMTDAVAWGRRMKDARVEAGDGMTDIPPHLSIWRGGKVVCDIICSQVNRDQALDAAWIAVPGFSADELWLALDTHAADSRFFKRYGRLPDPHELEMLCEEGACEIGLISDSIVVTRMFREPRRVVQSSLTYHMDYKPGTKEAERCHWMEKGQWTLDTDDPDSHIEGLVVDALHKCFDKETAEAQMAKHPEAVAAIKADNLTQREIRLHTDMAMLRILAGLGYVVAYLGAANDEEAEIVRRSIERMHGAVAYDGEGNEIRSQATATPLDLLLTVGRETAKQRHERVKAEEDAERERRRALRINGLPSDEDRERAERPNRAERRAAEREARKR